MAHQDDYTFRSLLTLLNDERNDIFIHMDKKNNNYRTEDICEIIKTSRVYHCEPINCSWGGFSLIRAELELLELATKTDNYQYYHLLSGQDLPLKDQDTIHDFFHSNSGKEFIRFNFPDFRYKSRVDVYHLFQDIFGRKASNRLNSLFLGLQRIIGINRNKHVQFQKGTQWFSITDQFARYVVSKKKWIYSVFKYTFCPDELVIQTLFINSPFKDNLYHREFDNDCIAIVRLIDWMRGSPYVFRKEDFEELINSPYMYARKFDCHIDKTIIDLIVNSLKKELTAS